MILEVKNDILTGKGTENTLHLELIKKDKEIERLNNIINEYEKIMKECSDRILKELNKNNHLSYGPALSINYKLINYKELKEGK